MVTYVTWDVFLGLSQKNDLKLILKIVAKYPSYSSWYFSQSFPVAQLVEHGASNAKIMGLIPRESKS